MLVRILGGSAIYRLVPGMRGVLGAIGCSMLELVDGFLDVCGHGDFTSPFVVVPVSGETTIEGASSVDGDSIQLLESLDEMVSISFPEYLTTKSSTTRENKIYLVTCFQRKGVRATGG